MSAPPRTRRRPPTRALLVVAAAFAVVLAYPYLGLDRADSRIPVRDGLHYAVLVIHVFAATVALVLGPLQFIDRVRTHRRLHRTIGRTYLIVGVVPAAVTAIPVAAWSGSRLSQVGLTAAAILWLLTGALAYRAARRRDFVAHRAWMMRNYALTFLAVTSRILVPLMLLAQIPLGRVDAGSIGDHATATIPLGQTIGWMLNLVVIELVIRRRQP